MSYIGNKEIVKVFIGNKEVTDIFAGNNKVYSSAESVAVCQIRGLGNAYPTRVTFTKTENFPTESQAWEEVVIDGNYFAKFTPWYKKPIYSGDELVGFDIQNAPGEGFIPYDCFLDENGNLLPYILIGRYCASNTSTINSTDNTRATAQIGSWRSLAQAKGTGYQIMDAAIFIFWRDLALAISERVNFNSGSGVASYLGLARMTDGAWWIDGLTHVDNKYLYCNKPSKYQDEPTNATDGYNELAYNMPIINGGCVSKLGYDANNPTVNVPSATVESSSYNTYYCDALFSTNGNRPLYISVGYGVSTIGLFFLGAGNSWSNSSGAILCYRPIGGN